MSPLTLTVVTSQPIADGALQRLKLTGEGLQRIPDDYYGKHIKLLFKRDGQQRLQLPIVEHGKVRWPDPAQKPFARTYSIYQYDRLRNELTVDFVAHQPAGVASRFASQARPGDELGFSGPGPATLIDRASRAFLLVADLSALPAVAAIAESLRYYQQLHILLELVEPRLAEQLIAQYLPTTAPYVRVVPQRFNPQQTLVEPFTNALAQLPEQGTSIVLAGEHSSVVTLRKICRDAGIARSALYAVPYWRHLQDEDSYHNERHEVLDN